MPVALTYPGVYVEEIPSGVRTITGVATSVTAFVGRARRGPVNVPVVINGYADYERIFGGLWLESSMSYAVRDYFLNGGGQGVVVRLYHAAASPAKSQTPLAIDGLGLKAAYPGSWGENLRITIDGQVTDAAAASLGPGLTAADLFNLRVTEVGADGTPVRTETFRNLTIKESARRIDRVLEAESNLVRWGDSATPPSSSLTFVTDLRSKETDVRTAEQTFTTTPNAANQAALDTARNALAVANSDAVSQAERTLAAKKKKLKDAQAAGVAADIATAQGEVTAATTALTTAVGNVDTSDGDPLTMAADFTPPGGETNKTGIYALANADIFNILCIPPYLPAGDVDASLVGEAAVYCEKRRAMLLVDPPSTWTDTAKAKAGLGTVGTNSKNAALYFPRLTKPNPLRDEQLENFVPCGAVAGIYARTDTTRGIWKAPAGLEATLIGVPKLSVPLTDAENGELNPLGINCLRAMVPAGRVVWGARTLQGHDGFASEWKYVPVRRTALYIEESLFRGTQWVVFEPNDEPLWAQIRLNVGAFMQNLFRQGAFQGTTPKDAYFVKCDKETTTQTDINLGIVNIVVGFAPLKPAEFVVIKLQQMAGQIDT
jgi:uncharacterized protein